MKRKIGLIGAGGKMGGRISRNFSGSEEYDLLCVEVSEAGKKRLVDAGFNVVDEEEAVAEADVFILAIPDVLIGKITHELIPRVKSGSLIIGLDPAAAYAGVMPNRDDITYFVTHPCHPILFNEKDLKELEEPDWFGGGSSPQSIVCALYKGDESQYDFCESLAREMYKPILRSHRITIEQMAILEPAVVETTTASLILACKQALDKGIEMGVPREAAWDFVMGHIRVELAIIFGFAGFPFSDGAKKAIEQAQQRIFKDNWMDSIFDKEEIYKSVRRITGVES